MSGHSKWSTIKRKKGAIDAKRGKIFTKLIKEITVAARMGGGDPQSNPRLRQAIDSAKTNSMPKDNIERAIKKGTGELGGEVIEQSTYEGYGPGGVAIMVEVATDNKNRTVGEIRHLFSRYNGNLAQDGAVAWMFDRLGYISVAKGDWDEDQLLEIVLENGADDLKNEDEEYFEIYTDPTQLYLVKNALVEKNVACEEVELRYIAKNIVAVSGKVASSAMKLIELLEDHEDVITVSTNFEPPDDMPEDEV